MLIIFNVWVGFFWKKSWHTRCSSMYSGFMSNTKPRDWQESSNRCQRPTVGAVLKLLLTLSDYYAYYFSYYTHDFKTTNCVSGQYSLRKSAFMISGPCHFFPPFPIFPVFPVFLKKPPNIVTASHMEARTWFRVIVLWNSRASGQCAVRYRGTCQQFPPKDCRFRQSLVFF